MIVLLCNGQEVPLKRPPKTYSLLKKEVEKIIPLPQCYLFLIGYASGSKNPVTSSKAYSRALSFAPCTQIELIPIDASQEIQFEADFQIVERKKREILVEKNDPVDEGEMCIICYERLRNPMAAKCGHVCCKKCWEKVLENYLECPMCKSRVRISQLKEV